MLGGRLEQVTAEVHMQCNVLNLCSMLKSYSSFGLLPHGRKTSFASGTDKNDIQDLNDVIMVEQEEKNDMQRKFKSAENECKCNLDR